MSKTENASAHATAHSAARHAYEGSVTSRALQRAGNNPHLKGVVHEVMVADKMNVALSQLFAGQKTALTKSTTAGTVDLVTTKGAKVIERLQLKDVLSDSQASKVVRQVASGKYQTARLVGTSESAAKLNASLARSGSARRVIDSGVSSDTTTRLAWQAGARGSGSLASAVKSSALSGGKGGAAVSAGFAVFSGIGDLMDGKRDLPEVVVDVGVAAAKGYAVGAASTAAATAVSSVAAPVMASAAASLGLGTAATGIVAAVPGGVVLLAVGALFSCLFG